MRNLFISLGLRLQKYVFLQNLVDELQTYIAAVGLASAERDVGRTENVVVFLVPVEDVVGIE